MSPWCWLGTPCSSLWQQTRWHSADEADWAGGWNQKMGHASCPAWTFLPVHLWWELCSPCCPSHNCAFWPCSASILLASLPVKPEKCQKEVRILMQMLYTLGSSGDGCNAGWLPRCEQHEEAAISSSLTRKAKQLWLSCPMPSSARPPRPTPWEHTRCPARLQHAASCTEGGHKTFIVLLIALQYV